jgi:hypothetical protein
MEPAPESASMDALASSLERSPELFPHAWDLRSDAVTLVRLTKADYEKASFLDERVLRPHTLARTLPFGQLAAAVSAGKLEERSNFIFHIGHVGSTLLSRLLDEEGGLFALREPAILRTLARMRSDPELQPSVWGDAEFEDRLSLLLKLWSRTFEPGQTAVIKTTSFVSELAGQFLRRPSKPKAVLLFVRPESYIATILGGANARQEAKLLTDGRLKRLHRRIGRDVWRLASFSEGEGLALSWAAEMSALIDAQRAGGSRVLPLDFDRFLEEPQEKLSAVLRHFDSNASSDSVARILAGPHMQRYSKAPEHAYSPALRREILDDARKAHATEIAKGLTWLERAANEFPLIAECLAMSGH